MDDKQDELMERIIEIVNAADINEKESFDGMLDNLDNFINSLGLEDCRKIARIFLKGAVCEFSTKQRLMRSISTTVDKIMSEIHGDNDKKHSQKIPVFDKGYEA